MEKENQILVSVVVTSFNSSKYIRSTLDSVYKQSYENIELIITDDGSTDNTVKVVEKWLGKYNNRFTRTQLLTVEKNTGISPNCNRGFRASTGEYIKIIGGDDILLPNCVEDMLEGIIKQQGDIAFCYEYMFYDKDEKKLNEAFYKTLDVRPTAIGIYKCSQISMYKRILQANQFPAPTSFMSRKIYDELGGFDEEYLYMEDYPLWIKALQNNAKIVFVETYGVLYRKSTGSISYRENEVLSITQSNFQRDLSKFIKNVRDPELRRLGVVKVEHKPAPKTPPIGQNVLKWEDKVERLKYYAWELKMPRVLRLGIMCLSPKLVAKKIVGKVKAVLHKYEYHFKGWFEKHILADSTSKIAQQIERMYRFKKAVAVLGDDNSKKTWMKDYIKCVRDELKYKTRKPEDKIKILFPIQMLSTLSAIEPIYEAAMKDNRLEVILLAIPSRQPGMENRWYYWDGLLEYLDKKGYCYELGYEAGKWKNIVQFNADGVFYQTPYHIQRHPIYSPKNTLAFPKIMYTPYGPWIMDKSVEDYISIGIDRPFFDISWKIFVDKLTYELVQDVAGEYIDRTVLSGSPKVDFHRNPMANTTYCWKQPQDKEVKRIIWLPRWGVVEGRTAFFDFYKYFIDLVNERDDIDFVMRPHPFLFKDLKRSKLMTITQIDALKGAFEQPNNSAIDYKEDYREGIMSCDFIVADFTSIIYEYLPTNKPIIYTKKDNTLIDPRIMRACYIVTNQDELEEAMDNLLNGIDPLLETRRQIVQELNYYPHDEETNGKYIASYIAENMRRG